MLPVRVIASDNIAGEYHQLLDTQHAWHANSYMYTTITQSECEGPSVTATSSSASSKLLLHSRRSARAIPFVSSCSFQNNHPTQPIHLQNILYYIIESLTNAVNAFGTIKGVPWTTTLSTTTDKNSLYTVVCGCRVKCNSR